jgi:glutamyl-tRNA reductase
VLVIGAGETAELLARALVSRGVATVFVANRHYDRAIGLAQRFEGNAVRFEELPEQLEQADIVVSATNSPHHIVERDDLEQVMATREGRPLLLVDIAVPRDIEPACREIAGVSLHDIDDVQKIIERNTSGREAEAAGGAADRRRAGPLRALARLARGGADDHRPARARRRGGAPGAGRERGPLGEPQ